MTAGQRRKAIGDCHHRSDALKRMPPRILTRPKGRDHRRRDREHAGKNRNSARTREAIVAGAKPAEKQWGLRAVVQSNNREPVIAGTTRCRQIQHERESR
jgi:hypothetical protein